MAFGLTPSYSIVFPIEGYTQEEFLVLAHETLQKLNWNISLSAKDGLEALTPFRRGARNERIRLQIEEGVVTLKSESLGSEMIDWGRNKRNTTNFVSTYDEVRSAIKPEELHEKLLRFNESSDNASDPGLNILSGREDAGKSFFALFIPVKDYFITPILIDLNILVFIVMVASGANIIVPDVQTLIDWGANVRSLTFNGEQWRLFTNIFLHYGILHLLFNMYALLYIGVLLEPRLGRWRFLTAYIITGLVASLMSAYWHENTASAGASGAIFGMYGVFFSMLTTNLINKEQRKAFMASIGVFIGYNLINGLKGGIDNAAHIGGLVSGVLIGYTFYPALKSDKNWKTNLALPAICCIVLLVVSSWACTKVSNDMVVYEEKMKSFAAIERQALKFYEMPQSSSREEYLAELKNRGLHLWNKDRDLMLEMDKLDLPKEIHKRNKSIIAYCDLRIKSYELIYRYIEEDNSAYKSQIEQYNSSIDSLIKSLNAK